MEISARYSALSDPPKFVAADLYEHSRVPTVVIQFGCGDGYPRCWDVFQGLYDASAVWEKKCPIVSENGKLKILAHNSGQVPMQYMAQKLRDILQS